MLAREVKLSFRTSKVWSLGKPRAGYGVLIVWVELDGPSDPITSR